MNKKVFAVAILVFFLAGGVLVYMDQAAKDDEQNNNSAAQNSQANSGSNKNTSGLKTTGGSYITLDEYNANPSKYSGTKKVHFFHATWCPICQSIDKEIKKDASKIPAGVTLIKTDFDSSIDLRKKFGVTYQYTFVQIDSSGNETAQWSASTLEDAIAGIKS